MTEETEEVELTASEIDILMSLDPLELTSTPARIDQIIAYMRRARANFAAGIKAPKASGPKIKLDLKSLGLAKPSGTIKRRV